VIGLARSSLQYRPNRGDDDALRLALIRLAKQYGRYGYRKVGELLRIEGWTVNHKKVERLSGARKGFSFLSAIRSADGSITKTARSSGCGRPMRTTSGASAARQAFACKC